MKQTRDGWMLLHRASLALLGVMFVLFGAGAVLFAARQFDASVIGTLVGAVVGVALLRAGVPQVRAAISGRLPHWYSGFVLFAGGVLVGGPRSAKETGRGRPDQV